MNIDEWYAATVGDDSENAVAARAGIQQRTLNGQRRRDALSIETVVAVAHAYGADLIRALEIMGVVTAEDVARHGIRGALADATDADIMEEIWGRLQRGEAGPEITGEEPDAPVDPPTPIRGPNDGPKRGPDREIPDWAADVAADDPRDDPHGL